jgi:hypothetical protein
VSRRAPRVLTLLMAGLLCMLFLPAGPAHAGGPGTWTKLAEVGDAFDTAGMLRTADGKLHLVWRKSSNTAYGTSTIAINGGLLATGTALSGWNNDLEYDPQLVKMGSGMRLVFEGSMGNGFYMNGGVFTVRSSDGKTWTLEHDSMASHSAGIGNLSATAEKDGTTPVATFAGGHLFHVGLDPNNPASTPDGTITPTPNQAQFNPAIATDSSTGSVYVGWYQASLKPGYWVERILTPQGSPVEAPGSDDTSPKQDNEPRESVALTARPGGGVYMAYCVATSTQQCAHIDLWKVGASSALVVPGSKNSTHTRVALGAGLKGRLSVVWYDGTTNDIHAVRTNTTATKFGPVRTTKAPSNTFGLDSVQAEGTFGRLDVIINDQVTVGSVIHTDLFQTQILAGLTLTATPSKFSHTKATTVTFKVTDAGQAVPNVKVTCIGKSATTGSTGTAKITFPKGTATGKHVCTAGSPNYNPGKTTLTVT